MKTAFLAILVFTSIINCNAQTFQEYLDSATARFELKNYQGAVEDYNKAIEINANNISAYVYRGRAKDRLKDYAGAIADCNKAIEINPDTETAYIDRAYTEINLENYQAAIRDCNKAISINPGNEKAYDNRASAKIKLEDYHGVIEDCNMAIAINPDDEFAYNNWGIAKRYLKDYTGAMEDFNKSIEIDTLYAKAFVNRALLKDELEDYKGVIEDCNKAILIDFDYVQAWLLLGNGYYKLNKNVDKALYFYKRTLQLQPGYYEGVFNIGTVLLEADSFKEAIPYLKWAIMLKPEKVEANYNLADAFVKSGKGDSAIVIYHDLAKMQVDSALPIYKTGTTYGRVMHNLDSAIIYLNKAVEMDPKKDLYREDLCVAYGMKGDYANIIKFGEKGIKINPKYAPYYNILGVTYKQLNNKTKADTYFKKATELDPVRYPGNKPHSD